MKTKPPSIICTDDAWLLGAVEPPLSIEDLKEKMVDAYEGTPAALWWSIGDHEVYNFETEIGEIVGDAPGGEPGPVQTVAENVRHLMETCGGPLTALIQLCREADRPFFARVRINSHYDRVPFDPGWGRFRREHPEFLIGQPGENLPAGSIEYGIRTGLNFVFPQVRRYKSAIICEVFERYELDQTARFTTPYHCAFPVGNIEAAFRYGSPDAQLPVAVEETLSGRGPVLCLQVADNLESARTTGALARCLLALRFDNLTPDDVLEVTLNQELLPWPPSRVSFDGWMRQEVEARFWEHYPARIIEVKQPGVSVEYAVTCPPLSQGENRLEVRLLTDRREESEPVLLKSAELLLEYEE